MPDLQVTMANLISTSASQTTLSLQEMITTMKASGMADSAIKQTLMNDLNSGGPLFGAFKNKIKNTVKNGVELSSNGSANGQFVKAGVERFQWVTVGGDKVCPDCAARHGLEGTNEYFDTIGREGSGFSVCQQNCRCKILPVGYKDENLDKPLVREKKITDKDLQKRFYKNHNIGYKNKDGSIGGVHLSKNIKSDTEIFNAIKKLDDDGYRTNWFQIDASKQYSASGIASSTSTPVGHKLELNGLLLRDRKKMKTMYKKEVSSERFFKGGDTIKATIDHEFAHSITITPGDQLIVHRRSEFLKIQNDYFKKFDELKNELFKATPNTAEWQKVFDELSQTKISNYAKESLEEFVAEAFSMSRNSANPSEFAIKINDLIDDIVKSKH